MAIKQTNALDQVKQSSLDLPKENPNRIEKHATNMHHIFLIDWNDDGLLKEIAVVLEAPDGTIYGIEIDKLHSIDKSRLKNVITSVHANKYPLWELLSQTKLKNGLNALDFFHANYVKPKRPKGAILTSSFADVVPERDGGLIGSQFSDPTSATMVSPSEMPISRFA